MKLRLKKKAHEKRLIMMGPDCGKQVYHGWFQWHFTEYSLDQETAMLVLQELGFKKFSTTIIDKLGAGLWTNAIGTGGRDFISEEVGRITIARYNS